MSEHTLQRIEDLLESDGLTAWEADFLESLQTQVRAGKELSKVQKFKLEEIEGGE